MIIALLALFLSLPPAAPPPRITLYDLTYLHGTDINDPRQVADLWDQIHFTATLQGIVNRDEPRLYLRYVGDQQNNVDDYWLERMSEPGQWLAGRRPVPARDLHMLLRRFRQQIQGAVIYDPAVPATSNLASTIAGVEDLVAIRYDPGPDSLYHRMIETGPRLPVVRMLLNRDGTPMFTGEGTIPETDLPSTGSTKCDAYLWLKTHYIDTGKAEAGYAGYYIDAWWMKNPGAAHRTHHTLTNHDYFVAKRGWFFDLNVWADETPVDDRDQPQGTDLATLKQLLLSAYKQCGPERLIHIGGFTPWAFKYTTSGKAGGTHDPVPTEWETVRVVSSYNAFIDADAINLGAMANASFFMHFPLKEKYPQPRVTREQLIERGYLTARGELSDPDREYMIFYVGDYDSAAWLYQRVRDLWDHPQRGELPLMWCISPVLERRAPMALDYLRRTASANDYFAAADNGAGYLNPGCLQEPRPVSGLPSGLDAWARHCEPIYRRWDISITGFVIDGYAPGLNQKGLDCYARFSQDGIVPQKVPATLLHGVMPVLRAGYDLEDDPARAAQTIVDRVEKRTIPFHWFRAILKGPDWYKQVHEAARAERPEIELLDAPTFFELYRCWLETHPEAAAGRIDCPR